jgi:hypothetical protein
VKLHFLHKAEAAAVRRGELPSDAATVRMVPGDDPPELRPVRRMSFTQRSHVDIGIKGGQGRSGADIEESAERMLIAIAILGVLALVIVVASAWA